MKTQIQSMTANSADDSEDTGALEAGPAALAEANPGLAGAIAAFASSNIPTGIDGKFADTLVDAIGGAIVAGAPSKVGGVFAAVTGNQPQFAETAQSGNEASLQELGFETAAGGGTQLVLVSCQILTQLATRAAARLKTHQPTPEARPVNGSRNCACGSS